MVILSPNTIDSAQDSVRSRLDSIAHEVWFELSTLVARVNQFPETQRTQLYSRLLDLQSLQLRLRRFADEILPGEKSESEKLELAIEHHLNLLEKLKAFAERGGLFEPSVKLRADEATTTSAAGFPDDVDAT